MIRMRIVRWGLLLGTLILAGSPAWAARADSVWQAVRETSLAVPITERVLASGRHAVRRLDPNALGALLAQAPHEGDVDASLSGVTIALPMPDGRLADFHIVESPVMEPELQAQHPEIRTYRGQGIDDPTATVRFDWTPRGFHALVLSGRGTIVLEPYSKRDRVHYISYDKRDFRRRTPVQFRCGVTGRPIDEGSLESLSAEAPVLQPFAGVRVYRLALAADHEYVTAVGCGTDPNCALAAMTTSVNDVNAVYERDLAVHLNLISGTNIIFTDPSSDPYTDNNGEAMLTQNQTTLDSIITNSNYDIGHVFSTGGGGLAEVGVVCATGGKAHGVTGSSNPEGPDFDIDYVAHEMGHEFGADHTFNGTVGACGGGNRSPSTAYEPGSGSTIMAYAGICGSQNLQPHSDAYFHLISLSEITTYMNQGGGCVVASNSSGDAPPTLDGFPQTNYTIPLGTPFALTASATAHLGGDSITYAWEDYDLAHAPSPPDTDSSTLRPIFRSFSPSSSGTRTFPQLSDILSNHTTYGESLPTWPWVRTFQVTARDNHAGGGAVSTQAITVTIDGNAGPFRVTAPNASTAAWPAGGSANVAWDVANTTGSITQCANVDILLSTDGGTTFPSMLASAVANSGSSVVSVPTVLTTQARVKVACTGNIFFGISSADFLIAPPISVAATNSPVTEGNSGTTNATFTVTLGHSPTQVVTASYATASGTATSGSDFVPTSGVLTFDASTTVLSQIVNVPVIGDTTYERDETFTLNLTAASNAAIVTASATATILNDDQPPVASIDNASSLEGNSGQHNMVLTARLNAKSGVPAIVTWATSDGTAHAGIDYVATGGTLTFAPGTTTHTLAVPVIGNTSCDPNRTFSVNITAVGNDPVNGLPTAQIGASGVGTIVDDDGAGTFSFSLANYTTSEKAASALIKVSRVNGPGLGSVDYAASDGTAVYGTDYGATPTPVAGTLKFAARQTSATFSVPIIHDTLNEPNKTVLFKLGNPQGCFAGLGSQSTSLLTITDSNPAGTLSLSAPSYVVNEPASPPAAAATITVKRAGGTASGVTVQWTLTDGTASFGTDYSTPGGLQTGTLTFGAGATSATFQVLALPESTTEGNKTLGISLSNPGGGAVLGIPATSVLTVVEEGPSVQFAQANYSVSESAKQAVITVKRTGSLAPPMTVDYGMSNGTAQAGTDYVATSSTLSFGPGVASRTFAVGLLNDNAVAGDKSLNLMLSGATLAGMPGNYLGTTPGAGGAGTATLTITDLQETVAFSVPTYGVSETLPQAIITVKRSGKALGTVTVDYATSDGSAVAADGDYSATSGTLTFGQGVVSRTFAVRVFYQNSDEGTETVNLTLSNAVGALITGTNPAVLNLLDKEATFHFSAAKYTLAEAKGKIAIAVARTGSTAAAAFVDYSTSDGSATAGADYVTSSGTLTFAPGVVSRTFTVSAINDGVAEPSQTVNLALTQTAPGNPAAGDLPIGTPGQAVLTITNAYKAGNAQLSAANYSVAEPAPATTIDVAITVSRTGGTSAGATVDWTLTDGTAVFGTDYTTLSATQTGTLTFAAGQLSQSFVVTVMNDGTSGANKSLGIGLGNPGGGLTLGPQSSATLWIVE
jgi:hypothetical protein